MKKLIAIIVCFVICLTFAGCDVNISSVDILMRPPKLSGKNSLLQQTFETTVGDSESIVMKSPISGEYRSSYLLYDLDNDSVSEALVLYSDPVKDEFAYVSVFKFLNDKWSFVSTIKGRSEEVYAVDFADINGDGIFEILISWSSSLSSDSLASTGLGSSNDRILAIYSYNGSSTTILKTENYTKLLVEDINGDEADELFIINISLSNQEKVTEGRIVSFDSEYSIDRDIKFSLTGMLDVYNIVCDSYTVDEETHSRVYVDGSISDTGIITEIIDVSHNTFEVSLPLYESNVSAQPVTLRDVRVYSQDFDNDGVVEVPTLEKLFGGVRFSDNSEQKNDLNLTVWSEADGNELIVETKCLLNGTYGYMFIFPDEWIENITAVYNENTASISFYSIDYNETLISELFSIKAVLETSWEKDDADYTKFDENGVFVYGYLIIDEDNKDIYIDAIENNFILVNQE